MADGIASGPANSVLALLFNGTAFAGFATPFAQLHVGSPGAAGTTNPAGNTVRQATGAIATPVGGSATNVAAINWTSVSTSETYSHVSIWSAASGGTFIASGTITAAAVVAGNNFQIAIGGMTVSIPVAS
jgi:hypothetical protein